MKVKNNKLNQEKYLKVAKKVAKYFSSLENVVTIVIGGSLARNFYDTYSDIEMYVYYSIDIPSEESVRGIIRMLNSKLNRSKKIYWYHKAWGYHTFFEIDGIKIELGYRKVSEIEERMNLFMKRFSLPQHGIHDTPFGHYESGVASCILSCVPIFTKAKSNWLAKIKERLQKYPVNLKKDTLRYYYRDAKVITKIKIKNAVRRNDTLLFNACLSRVIRSINLCLFALNEVYYPGDKWNHKYISEFSILPKDYSNNMDYILSTGCISQENKKSIYKRLNKLVKDLNLLINE
jgi:hypothetical protein